MTRRSDITRPPGTSPATTGGQGEVAAFLAEAARVAPPGAGRGRLVFALDATLSRQPTWDLACSLQGAMFDAAAKAGGLTVQLVYFRGLGEARASRWVRDARSLKGIMSAVSCRGGLTQIGRVLDHAARGAAEAPVAALVFVGDAAEEEIDDLAHRAGKLALQGTRVFMFLEGREPAAERAFREVARLTRGAFLRFDPSAPRELAALLAAVGAWAAGGRAALEATGTPAARRLLADLG